MRIISLMLTVSTFLLVVSTIHARKNRGPRGPQCSTCKEIVRNFAKGVELTKKSNYGGGNTEWEESRLGQYSKSEVRLVEIMEILCMDASKECHQMVEENEGLMEEFWFTSSLEKTEDNFHEFFCIKHVKVCCPENTVGPDCTECPGGKERPCRDNGKCLGAGTRDGLGKCKCNPGYKGKLCDTCTPGYYESLKNETHSVCKVCHISCKSSCTGDGPTHCDECKGGWTHDKEAGCQDINECENNPCSQSEYCVNTQGSYACMGCSVACEGCTGAGADNCKKCKNGYRLEGSKCIDIDECTAEGHEQLCTSEGQKCENTMGSYKCACQPGYIKDGDICKLKPKPEEKSNGRRSENRRHNNHGNMNRREESLITLLFGFFALSVIFFVLGKLCYVINPKLVSIPVAVFAIMIFYLINDYD